VLSEEELRRYDTDGILPISKLQVQIAEIALLRERVAELETDAKLGQLVRHMRPQDELYRDTDPGVCIWWCRTPAGFFEGDTPEAALEAARKEENENA